MSLCLIFADGVGNEYRTIVHSLEQVLAIASGGRPQRACQFLIIGAGITGQTIARELLARGADDIVILDKEKAAGAHASGRNSGVLHAGIYYTPDSLKARYCAGGNRLMKEFCRQRALTLHESGKVVVAMDAVEADRLSELKARADSCGARARFIDTDELAEIEPHAATYERALFSPDTAIIRPLEILRALEQELVSSGKVRFYYGAAVRGPAGRRTLSTSRGFIAYDTLVNAAGTHADVIAHRFGVGREYKILPFKGTYKKLVPGASTLIRGNVYPVPDLRNPFLGVHFTRSADGTVYVGPTAIPALGRENYRLFDGWSWETPSILYRDGVLIASNDAFRNAATTEPKRYVKRILFQEARKLVPSLRLKDLENSPKVGVRPQLVHWPTRKLVMDFVTHYEDDAYHILNAISPAFTSSMAFAQHVVGTLTTEKGQSHAVSVSTT